ncbi:hypothetical protein [Pseudokineococcus sp. 1T1Z-3]|uniref:hypothetical protein n=1 Tax=Pseudokineococcus sp. 1T1Z-3 TaxID=3132745 RepID=UPI0030ACDF09
MAFVALTANMTLKTLNSKLLEFYGHPAAQRTTSSRLASLAVDCVVSCQTRTATEEATSQYKQVRRYTVP